MRFQRNEKPLRMRFQRWHFRLVLTWGKKKRTWKNPPRKGISRRVVIERERAKQPYCIVFNPGKGMMVWTRVKYSGLKPGIREQRKRQFREHPKHTVAWCDVIAAWQVTRRYPYLFTLGLGPSELSRKCFAISSNSDVFYKTGQFSRDQEISDDVAVVLTSHRCGFFFTLTTYL